MSKDNVCEWRRYYDEESGIYYWYTSCFQNPDSLQHFPTGNATGDCPYCGKQIRVIEEAKDG